MHNRPAPHPDWYHDGVEEGEDLWRLDLPDIQFQLFVKVQDDTADDDQLVYLDQWRLLIEHDVRDTSGDRRVKYSYLEFQIGPAEARSLLTMPRDMATHQYSRQIAQVKARPSDVEPETTVGGRGQ